MFEQVDRALNAADEHRREHREPGRHVEVEDLLHEPHRRFVRRARDQNRRIGEHRGGEHNEWSESLFHRLRLHSVISGSNVHNDSVIKTTSNAASSEIHMTATASSGVSASSADVPRTPAMITGTVIGYNRIGSMISRVRERTSIAANRVPTAANPIVPDASRPTSSTGRPKSGALNSRATSGTSNASATAISSTIPSSLPT